MVLMVALTRYIPSARTTFLLGTLSLCGVPSLACFWSKDEILGESWLYLPSFSVIIYFIVSFWEKEEPEAVNSPFSPMKMNNENKKILFFSKDKYKFGGNVRNQMQYFTTSSLRKKTYMYHREFDNTISFPLLILVIFTYFLDS